MPVKFRPWHYNHEDWGFTIEEGAFTGTSIALKKVDFDSDERMAVEYNVLTVTSGKDPENADSAEFSLVFNDVINQIILQALEFHETRNTYSKQSDSQG